MDGSYGLTEEISKAHQRQLLDEASRERVARQAMIASTSARRRVLRADFLEVIEGLARGNRGLTAPPRVAAGGDLAATG